jgi:nucleotide-binding universal stress UspA family protein
MFTKILVAVDGSENNKIAIKDAIAIAKAMGSELTAVHVVPGTDLKPNAFGGDVSADERLAILQKATDEAFSDIEFECGREGVELKTLALSGNPTSELLKATEDYDLVICGSLGKTGVKKALLGSVSSELAKSAKCPVLISR